MTNQAQRDATIRRPEPESAARDPRNAAQEQVHTDSEASRREIARMRAPAPAEVSQETVAEIAAAAEAHARP
jgi:hypothetical protein